MEQVIWVCILLFWRKSYGLLSTVWINLVFRSILLIFPWFNSYFENGNNCSHNNIIIAPEILHWSADPVYFLYCMTLRLSCYCVFTCSQNFNRRQFILLINMAKTLLKIGYLSNTALQFEITQTKLIKHYMIFYN